MRVDKVGLLFHPSWSDRFPLLLFGNSDFHCSAASSISCKESPVSRTPLVLSPVGPQSNRLQVSWRKSWCMEKVLRVQCQIPAGFESQLLGRRENPPLSSFQYGRHKAHRGVAEGWK